LICQNIKAIWTSNSKSTYRKFAFQTNQTHLTSNAHKPPKTVAPTVLMLE